MSPTETPRERIAPWAVLAAMLLITALATKYVWNSSQATDRAQFQNEVAIARNEVKARIDTYVNVLRAAAGLFAASQDVTRDQFRQYVRALQVKERYPGIQGIGLSIRVPREMVPAVTHDMRVNEFPEFKIWPEEPPRSEYYPIVLLEPLDPRNRAAIGFDMFLDPTRREGMTRARDTAEPAATAPVTLIQEIDLHKQPGFLIYVPVYSTDNVPPTVAERRQQLYGFVYAPFRAFDFFNGVFRDRADGGLHFSVSDGSRLLFDSRSDPSAAPAMSATESVDVAGRKWTIHFFSARAATHPARAAAATALGGVAFSLLLFALVRVQSRARAAAEQTAEKLRRSEGELQKAARAKDEFLATLSHELRTPMTAILGWSKLLADDLDEETYRTAIDAIQKSGKAQAQLIDDLLDVSRITSGKMRIEPRPLDLISIARAAFDAVTPAAEAKGVSIRFDPRSTPLLVHGDSARLQQVMWNLLTNAVKFTPDGGTVSVELRGERGEAVLKVRDTGQGIDPQFLPHVFERFRQADSSSTRAHTGLGLGLAIVRHLIELHGGKVYAESDGEGKGSVFVVRLPLLDVETRPEDVDKRAETAIVSALQNAKVLVVDDEEDVRNYAGAVFRMSGSDVRCVKSAADALETISRWKPDVILTDISMPDTDGYELLRRIRALDGNGHVPVIALTAYARPEDREAVESAGFDGYIAKPADPTELRVAVAGVLAV